ICCSALFRAAGKEGTPARSRASFRVAPWADSRPAWARRRSCVLNAPSSRSGSSPWSSSRSRNVSASPAWPAPIRSKMRQVFSDPVAAGGPVPVGRLDPRRLADVGGQLLHFLVEQAHLGADEVDEQLGGGGRQVLAVLGGTPAGAPLRQLVRRGRLAGD